MLYVIRHGEVDSNVKWQINGWNEEELNETGVKQAINAGKQLKDIKIDLVICSPLLRTKQTYSYLGLDGIELYYDDRIKERNSNSMVLFPVSKIDRSIWYDKTKDIVYQDSEGFKSVIERTESILKEIKEKYKDKNVLLITHGDICKAIYLHFNPAVKEIDKFHQDNCEIISYEM